MIYLIRHGKPELPEGKRMCLGTTDIPLCREGREQAASMARGLPPVSVVFSSPLIRAVETAQAIGKPLRTISGLREYHMGQWDGLSFQRIQELYPALYEARGKDPSLIVPGEEDQTEGLHRFAAAMGEAIARSEGDIAVVAHGGVIAAFLESLGGKRQKPDYAQVTQLTYDGAFHIKEEDCYA